MITPQNQDTARQNWLFYVACDPQYGGGHMARSIALAMEMSYSSIIYFVLENPTQRWVRHLDRLGLNASVLEKIDTDISYHGLWVDHYQPDVQVLQTLKNCSVKSYALIDSAEQGVNYDECISYAKILSAKNSIYGFQYALIDPRYAQIAHKREKKWDIVISFGQTDEKNITFEALEAIENYESILSLGVVCGQTNMHKQSLLNHIQRSKHRVTLIENVDTLLNIFPQAQIYIGAGGVSVLEASVAGLACGIITTAKNQAIQTKALHEKNAVIWIGDSEGLDNDSIISAVKQLMDPLIQAKLSTCCKAIIDGKGSERLANHLLHQGS